MNRMIRWATCAIVSAALLGDAAAQGNEENWHPLSNGFDGIYLGLGSGGGLHTSADGLGTWIPGEELRGSTRAVFSGDFSYKMVSWQHVVCMFDAVNDGVGSYQGTWTWWEFDGRNPNRPDVFTVATALGAPGLISTATAEAYGTPPGSTASFLLAGLPSFLGTASFVVPNGGLLPSATGGTATLIAAIAFVSSVNLPTGCYSFELGFTPTTVAGLDDIDGWWNWNISGPVFGTARNYWGYSFDELDPWQSSTLESAGNFSLLFARPCVTDFSYHQSSFEANTTLALAPNGAELTGLNTYTNQTENTNPGVGGFPLIDPNGGYDVGRGHRVFSLSGTTGFADFNDVQAVAPPALLGPGVLAPQDPSGGAGGGGGSSPTIAFHTWDTRSYLGGTARGSERITWVEFDWDSLAAKDPTASIDILCNFGQVRYPFHLHANDPGGTAPQAFTQSLMPIFTHTTSFAPSGFPDPEGFLDTAGGDDHIAGTSNHIPTSASGINVGLVIGLQYGTSGLSHFGGLTCNPNDASMSGYKEVHLLD